MKKYIAVKGVANELIAYIEVDEKDVELTKQRMEALAYRWNKNEIEMYNNGSPVYIRNVPFEILLDMYLVKDGLVKGPNIQYESYDAYYTSKKDVVGSYRFKYLMDIWC